MEVIVILWLISYMYNKKAFSHTVKSGHSGGMFPHKMIKWLSEIFLNFFKKLASIADVIQPPVSEICEAAP